MSPISARNLSDEDLSLVEETIEGAWKEDSPVKSIFLDLVKTVRIGRAENARLKAEVERLKAEHWKALVRSETDALADSEALAAKLATVEAETIERCAKVADDRLLTWPDVASAIRALAIPARED